ncbi:MAG: DUF4301 family protein [Spirochaetales bacterium]|nr:DUF4301 family protein [Spirochaetales bacterium]
MLNDKDLEMLNERGMGEKEFSLLVEALKKGAEPADLVRAAVVDDGILKLNEEQAVELEKIWESQKGNYSFEKFVPASGAATRMFKEFFAYLEEGTETGSVRKFFDNLEDFSFYPDLGIKGEPEKDEEKWALLSFLLGKEGWNWGSLPKGMLPFHREDGRALTPFEDHLREGALCAGEGEVNIHFTVSPQHKELFLKKQEEIVPLLEEKYALKYNLSYSFQEPGTDTPALDEKGELFRKEDGSLLMRPGGHGSLIRNLNSLDRDIIFLKNIDNVGSGSYKELSARWFRIFGALLIKAKEELAQAEENLRQRPDESSHEAACKVLHRWGGIDSCDREDTRTLLKRLNRPVRICGMVKNDGDTGGGPFWIIDGKGNCSLQVVESAQIDKGREGTEEKLKGITHFNPVFIACSPKDCHGEKLDLEEYVDRNAFFTVEKSLNGRPLKALEHPGLWNGSMAFWNTTFVEIPAKCFNPVKSLPDLLQKAHLPEKMD